MAFAAGFDHTFSEDDISAPFLEPDMSDTSTEQLARSAFLGAGGLTHG
jgi:hypothetical protein